MGYKTFALMNIAIVGAGKVSEVLAQALALAEHEIFLATVRDNDPVSEYILDEFTNIHLATIAHAADVADIIILATEAEEVREAAYLLDDVRRKVIIDATAVLTEQGSTINTVNAIKAITGSMHVVKCYNNTGYHHPLFDAGAHTNDMYVAGESRKAKEIVKLLARDMELNNCHDLGGDDAIAQLENMARNWMQTVKQPAIIVKKYL
ncbi:MAG: NAD(P)-binding domain-containing protein [Taibaiella sp.]|nr:NAD(P)-binding domain-containing protein [Taibaiella sp.]